MCGSLLFEEKEACHGLKSSPEMREPQLCRVF